jgi:MFS family permease
MPQEQPALYNYDRKHRFFGLIAIFLTYGTMGYYIQASNIARPEMAASFESTNLISWSVSIPALVGAFVTLIFGKLSDMYGRRIILLISLTFALIGTVLSALSPTFLFLIIANSIASLGIGALTPLVMAVAGDMYAPVERSKWIGLLNIPMGISTLLGNVLGGYITEALSWNFVFWSIVPFLVLSLVMVPIGILPLASRGIKHKIDTRGCILAILASSTTIIGISIAGSPYPWMSIQVLGLLGISLIFWVLFIRAESSAREPILDPQLFHNRSFNTVAATTFLSTFGQIGMMVYFLMFMQGVHQEISISASGLIFFPFTFMMSFIGVPVGFLIARTRRYKYLYIIGFAIVTVQMTGILLLKATTPAFWFLLASVIGGIGLGAIPTVNTVVVQNVIPKRLLGAAMGALFFSLLMGVSISPAVLNYAMNSTYAKSLQVPETLNRVEDKSILEDVKRPDILQSEQAYARLKGKFEKMGSEDGVLFQQTVDAIRDAMENGLRKVFLIGAVTALLSFLLILTIPEVPIGSGVDE